MISSPINPWLRTNEIQEFIETLEFSADISKAIDLNISRWTWLLIATHSALQGAFVCALRGRDTSGLAVLDAKTGGQMFAWLEIESRKENPPPPPDEKLANFWELYRRVSEKGYLPVPLSRSGRQDADVKKLDELRNKFIHFVPAGLSLDLTGLPRLVENACLIIQHLAILHPTFDHHFEGDERPRIARALEILMAK